MKKILFIIFLFSFATIFAQSDLQIIDATKQDWAGGQMCTGFGTYYTISFIPAFNSSEMSIDTLWIGERNYPVTQLISNNSVVKEFDTDDTLYFQVSFRNYWAGCVPKDYRSDYNVAIPPIEYNGEALLECTIKDKSQFTIIEKLKELQYIAYP